MFLLAMSRSPPPLQRAFWNPIQLCDEEEDVEGVRSSLSYRKN